jgi:hypothetical protein
MTATAGAHHRVPRLNDNAAVRARTGHGDSLALVRQAVKNDPAHVALSMWVSSEWAKLTRACRKFVYHHMTLLQEYNFGFLLQCRQRNSPRVERVC